MADENTGETQVQVVKSTDVHEQVVPMERHVNVIFKEMVGPDAPMTSAGPIIGLYDAVISPGKKYWPRENERDVDRLIFVQSGSGRLHVGDTKHSLQKGDVARIHQGKGKEAHLKSTGEDRMRLLVIIFKNT